MRKTTDEIKKLTQLIRENPGDPIKVSQYTLELEEAYQQLNMEADGLSKQHTELSTKYQEAVELNGKLTLRISNPKPEPAPEDKPVKWSEIDL